MSHQEANGLVLRCSMQLVQCAPLMPSQISLNWPTLYVLKGCVAPRHDLHVAKDESFASALSNNASSVAN